ncbi:MAG TPA: hypothetical protein VN737_20110 [Bryobacteraceae bacterium]|nr:hypothetical protein [Bryobacteraceae bacterium]
MQTGQHQHSHHGCGGQSRGPEVFYGYCHETNRMRMMDYTDYMSNLQTGYSNLYSNPASSMQPIVNALSSMMRGPSSSSTPHHKHGCDCGCHEHDCGCSCCIRCADVVEYARCGEVRRIPITFDNDTRRERAVSLQLGNFATESGLDPGWQASLSSTQFTLSPCGETTVLLSVNVDCSKLGAPSNQGNERQPTTVDACKVVYATLRAEGCTIRPVVIAVAVLPEHCGAHHAGCGCCCN